MAEAGSTRADPVRVGLPPLVAACLFDLDGVLTQTAKVHAAAWKEMFDGYLKDRARRTDQEFVPFDAGADYEAYVDGKARADGTRSFLQSRGISLPEGSPDDPPELETVHGLGNRKNIIVQRRIREDGVEVYQGSVAYVREARRVGMRTAVVSSSANTHDVLVATGIVDLFDARSTASSPSASTWPASPPRTRSWPAPRRSGSARPRPSSSRTPSPGSRPAAPAAFGFVVGVDRVGQADALREHGADIVVADLAELLWRGARMIDRAAFPVEPWALRETELDLNMLAQTESVFALSNGHIGLRGNLDEGEPHGLPGTYLNSVYELRPLPYAEAGYGYPESGQTVINVTNGKLIRLLVDDEPFDVRYGELRSHERVLDLRAGALDRDRRVGLAGRGRRSGPLDAAGVVHPALGRWRSSTRSSRSTPRPAGRRAVRAGRERADAAPGRRPAGGGCARQAVGGQGAHGDRRAGRAGP